MNLVFLTLSGIQEIGTRGLYKDLMRKFRDEGHNVYIVSPVERQLGLPTELKEVDGIHILNVKTLNIQNTNIVEKGIGTILLETQFKRAIKQYLKGIKFDLILYSTPPITLNNVVGYLKKMNSNAICYLLLKDIFPQNAVDLGMFSTKSLFYSFFRKKEIGLYKKSNFIGCMSPANVQFILKNNTYIQNNIVEVAPNSLTLVEHHQTQEDKNTVRRKYKLPTDKPILIYGGNLGKPQGIDFLIKCLDKNKDRQDCHFLIVGNGTEYHKLESWYRTTSPRSVTLFSRLPKADYDQLVQSCDIGLIFLDHCFLIPNYPSRLLSYLEFKMPIVAATDVNTDIGSIAEKNGYGFWCESLFPEDFTACVDKILKSDYRRMGENGYQFLLNNYLTEHTYSTIMKHFN